AETDFDFLDDLRVETLGAPVLARDIAAALLRSLLLALNIAAAARESCGWIDRGATKLCDDLFDRSARRHLDDDEVDDHDPEQRGDHQQNTPDDIGDHCRNAPKWSRSARCVDETAIMVMTALPPERRRSTTSPGNPRRSAACARGRRTCSNTQSNFRC